MKLGLDFDNTLIDYDSIFYDTALKLGFIDKDIKKSKTSVRNFLINKNQENKFTFLQGEVYGKEIINAEKSEGMFESLLKLKNKGFHIKYEIPPKRGAFGLFHSKNKTIWISPISFELGIGRQTFLHEATHAAQSCPNGLLSPIGWTLPVNQSIKNEIQANLLRNYDINQYTIEKEAFYLQS